MPIKVIKKEVGDVQVTPPELKNQIIKDVTKIRTEGDRISIEEWNALMIQINNIKAGSQIHAGPEPPEDPDVTLWLKTTLRNSED